VIRLLLGLEEWVPGFGAFRTITFRALCAAVTAFLVCLVLGPSVIAWLRARRVGENIRTDSERLYGILLVSGKGGTPTMGGVLILAAVATATLLFGRLDNLAVLLALWTTLALGVLGAADDWMKLTVPDSKGMAARTKIACQGLVALLVVGTLWLHADGDAPAGVVDLPLARAAAVDLGGFYLVAGMFVVVGSSNAVNLTDGLDGLAAGCSAMAALALAPLAYAAGRHDWASFLHMSYVPGAGELAVFLAALGGACVGFLWWNCHPASVFMGNTGSLAIGGGLAVAALASRQAWALALAGGVFVWEALSVLIQVGWYKRTRTRVFRCAPWHHHLQFGGWKETQVVARLWICAAILAVVTLAVAKAR